MPPEDAKPRASPREPTSSALDDLVDGIDLLLRAARKTTHAIDPRVEKTAATILERLRQLDADMAASANRGIDAQAFQTIAREFGSELSDAVERVAVRIERTLRSIEP